MRPLCPFRYGICMNSDSRPNILVRLWLGFWRGLTAFRIAVFNILFLIVLAVIVRMMFFSGDALIIENDTTLVIAPNGMLVEEYTGTPVDRAISQAMGQEVPESRLRDVQAALEQAANDDRITQVLIHTDKLWGLAPGMMDELAATFAEFRESGKPVIAYGGTMLQGQYYLATLADEIWLDHDGMILIEGYGRYRQYYREGLEKLDVDVNLFRVGEFKSAMEPFIRDDMSEADRLASEAFLSDLWQTYLEQIALNRGLPRDVLADLINRLDQHVAAADGDLAGLLLERGLVDRLVSRPTMRAELANRGASDDNGGFRQIDFETYAHAGDAWYSTADQVAIIVAQGSIVSGDQPSGTIGADSTSRLIRAAAGDDQVKAVVLRIDSGGGSAFASEVIRNELQALQDAGKPVVVSMGNVAASGGYWIAMGADEIWAHPTTLTGSIGVFGFFPTFQNTLAKIGIYTDGVGTTPLSGALRVDRPLNDEARSLLQNLIEHAYSEFINLVAEHRQMNTGQVDQVAQGRVWTGRQAQQRGLVDQLGTLDQAVASAARIAGLGEDYGVRYIERELSYFERIFVDMGSAAIRMASVDSVGVFTPAAWLPTSLQQRLLDELRLIFMQSENGPAGVMAHCLCEAPQG